MRDRRALPPSGTSLQPASALGLVCIHPSPVTSNGSAACAYSRTLNPFHSSARLTLKITGLATLELKPYNLYKGVPKRWPDV